MKPTLLAGALAILVAGAAPAALLAQAKAPLQQPNSEAAAMVPAGELALGTVRVPKGLKADGKELPAGTYRVRLTPEEAAGKAPGATASYERYVEFVQGTAVKGREVVSIVPSADIGKVAKAKGPAPGAARVERLRGDDYVRVWINRGGNHYLIHLIAG
ncbi:MAG: hypothetical protein ABIT71_08920 [Vicinamibacteraceae bacterium]